jgi:5-oxoprolinase (ATP-hydrolysing)
MMSKDDNQWQIWIDTGGTFTDCLALDPSGHLHQAKVLSSSALRGIIDEQIDDTRFRTRTIWSAPDNFLSEFKFRLLDIDHEKVFVSHYDSSTSTLRLTKPLSVKGHAGQPFEVISPEEAPILAARLVTSTSMETNLPKISMRLATTLGTNALLERKGGPTALFITQGLGDLLRIGNQQRPDLFALNIQKPEPLYEAVVEVPERIAADGSVLQSIQVEAIESSVKELVKADIKAAAIAFMHSYVNPIHEEELEKITGYFDRVHRPISSGIFHAMNSTGGLVKADNFHAKDSLLSGPAGGVVGSAAAARLSGFDRAIAFDMGGTSTDVSRYDGDYEYVFEHEVGDAHLLAPALEIATVASGGGSICWYDGANLRVGPHSAGADPGPASYGVGGPLTVTDVNLLLGRLAEDRFEIPIDANSATRASKALLQQMNESSRGALDEESILAGLLQIANERMADAIRNVSIRKGYDPHEYALVAFGGAGAQHACAVASLLDMDTVIIPHNASLLSALGLGHAVVERFAERQILDRLDNCEQKVAGWIEELSTKAIGSVSDEGIGKEEITVRRAIINTRFWGQDATLSVEYQSGIDLSKEFESKYRSVFGHWPAGRVIEIESIRVVASSRETVQHTEKDPTADFIASPVAQKQSYFGDRWLAVDVYDRNRLRPGAKLEGPALIFENHSATVVEEEWSAQVDAAGAIVLLCDKGGEKKENSAQPEAVRLELFTNRFRAVAEDMGELLQRTAFSTNVKERLDFSCTLLDRDGYLVVNAPHLPVHLGAMGICVRRLCEVIRMSPGDMIVTNHPAFGGSHLPDVTVVAPAYSDDNELLGYVANRAHHAEIGGIRPGSMPPTATKLIEEGVVISPTYLVSQGEADWDGIRRLLTESMYPTRSVEENLADLNAAVAANHRGMQALQKMARQYGSGIIARYMNALKEKAELEIRRALRMIPDGNYSATQYLDDGTKLKVLIEIKKDTAVFDFSGTSGEHPGNLNATPAIVHSAVIYVLRLLVDEPLPLNEGLLQPITINIPKGILNPHFPEDPSLAPAVVGGNVETSQRLVDTLLKALEVVACSQGTMNNLLFGTDRFGYYETVCGGSGAGFDFGGTGAVHTHMTNTRITDPEIIEHRYPVRLDRFAIRKNSGGAGKHHGGDGVVREFTFLEPMSLSILSQHRNEGPYGLKDGKPGLPGQQQIIRADGSAEKLGAIDGAEVRAGDRLILETPGGGGYGGGGRSDISHGDTENTEAR